MVCKNCGIANSDASRFCSECGSVLPQPKPEEPTPPEEKTDYQPPVAQPVMIPVMPGTPVYAAQPVFDYQRPVAAQVNMPAFGAMPASYPSAAVVPPESTPPVQENPAPQAAQPTPPQAAPVPPVPPVSPMGRAPGYAMPTAPAAMYPPIPPVQGMPPMFPYPYGQGGMYGFPYSPLMKDPYASKVKMALWFGIVAAILPFITCFFASPVGLVLGILGVCFGAANLSKVFPQNKSKAIAAIVVGSIAIAISGAGCFAIAKVIAAISESEEFQQFNESFNSFIAALAVRAMKMAMIGAKLFIEQLRILLKVIFLK